MTTTIFKYPFYPDILKHFDVITDSELHVKGKYTREEFLKEYPYYETSLEVLEYEGVRFIFDSSMEESIEKGDDVDVE